jgi:hypothetical protein
MTKAPHRLPRPRVYDDQRYVCVGLPPYHRDDGHVTILEIWESRCVECFRTFRFKRSTSRRRFYPNRRCELHAKRGKRVPKLLPVRRLAATSVAPRSEPSAGVFG